MSRRKTKGSYKKRSEGPNLEKLTFASAGERQYVRRRILELCERIQKRRKAAKLSQERLAELTSISVSTIKFIEQGQRVPSLAMLLKILYSLDRDAVIWS